MKGAPADITEEAGVKAIVEACDGAAFNMPKPRSSELKANLKLDALRHGTDMIIVVPVISIKPTQAADAAPLHNSRN